MRRETKLIIYEFVNTEGETINFKAKGYHSPDIFQNEVLTMFSQRLTRIAHEYFRHEPIKFKRDNKTIVKYDYIKRSQYDKGSEIFTVGYL